jgi:hypothetical protein
VITGAGCGLHGVTYPPGSRNRWKDAERLTIVNEPAPFAFDRMYGEDCGPFVPMLDFASPQVEHMQD